MHARGHLCAKTRGDFQHKPALFIDWAQTREIESLKLFFFLNQMSWHDEVYRLSFWNRRMFNGDNYLHVRSGVCAPEAFLQKVEKHALNYIVKLSKQSEISMIWKGLGGGGVRIQSRPGQDPLCISRRAVCNIGLTRWNTSHDLCPFCSSQNRLFIIGKML